MRPIAPTPGAMEAQMHSYTAHVTPRDGIARRHSLTAPDLQAAHTQVRQLATGHYGAGFTYCVRPA
jgi:hypothetical protein